jgi:hypothetical protein
MRDASARTIVKVLRLFERTFVEITRGNQCIIDAIPEITCKRSDEFVAALPTDGVDGVAQWLPDRAWPVEFAHVHSKDRCRAEPK